LFDEIFFWMKFSFLSSLTTSFFHIISTLVQFFLLFEKGEMSWKCQLLIFFGVWNIFCDKTKFFWENLNIFVWIKSKRNTIQILNDRWGLQMSNYIISVSTIFILKFNLLQLRIFSKNKFSYTHWRISGPYYLFSM
jgi:hypothetical protein